MKKERSSEKIKVVFFLSKQEVKKFLLKTGKKISPSLFKSLFEKGKKLVIDEKIFVFYRKK